MPKSPAISILRNRCPEKWRPLAVGRWLREQAEAQTCLAASEYLVLRFGGVHQDAASYYRQMLAYLSERGYRLAGDSVEIALIDGGITGDEAQFVTELQIPFSR